MIEEPPTRRIDISVLANVYLHYILDIWFLWLKKNNIIQGESYLVRYADDFVVLFQYGSQTKKFYSMLKERMAKIGLEVEENKIKILPMERYKGTKESFDFLDFTHINGKTRNGKYKLIHHTSKKKLKQKKANVKKWIKKICTVV